MAYRAAMSLARLWREQGKRIEARDLLANPLAPMGGRGLRRVGEANPRTAARHGRAFRAVNIDVDRGIARETTPPR
jgi:hypothetical protein